MKIISDTRNWPENILESFAFKRSCRDKSDFLEIPTKLVKKLSIFIR